MFDITLKDSQATEVNAVDVSHFDFNAYNEYSKSQDNKVASFMEVDSGVLVYRRFRVAEVFGSQCIDKAQSLKLQLGALSKSMAYSADIANYLEPWYGIGIGASAFGAKYIWKDGQAPATDCCFDSIEDALNYESSPIESTEIGKEQLNYIEYFLDKTKGMLPMSMGDIQSPMNIISEVMNVSDMFMDMMTDPDQYILLAEKTLVLMKEFLKKEQELIGEVLVYPGHGFASSRVTKGLGVSADTSIMVNNEMFEELEGPFISKLCEPFGGAYFHSCGKWENKIPSVLKISGLQGMDAAFGSQTDPMPNDPAAFGELLAHTGKILNLRVVGDSSEVIDVVKKVWHPGLRLIVNTYCKTPDDQKRAYESIHEICQ